MNDTNCASVNTYSIYWKYFVQNCSYFPVFNVILPFHLVFLFIKLWLDMARFLTNAIFLNANPIRKRCLFDCDVYFNLILKGRCLFEASLMLEKILLFSLLLSTIRFTLD